MRAIVTKRNDLAVNTIIEAKHKNLQAQMARTSLDALRAVASMQRRPLPFLTHVGARTAIVGPIRYNIPMTGDLSTGYDPAMQAREYVYAGADAVAVFTDTVIERDGMADLAIVSDVLKYTETPVISQDYVLTEYHVVAARAAGASAVMLHTGIVSLTQLRSLMSQVHRNRMTAIVAVHNRDQLDAVRDLSPQVIGLGGASPLDTRVDCTLAHQLAAHVPTGTRVMLTNPLSTLEEIRSMADLHPAAVMIAHDLLTDKARRQHIRKALGQD
jgi:indole-3-glycerol phosphate synthase